MKYITILLLFIPKGFTLVAFDCSVNDPIVTTLSLIDTPPCSLKERNITKAEKYIQLIQPKTLTL